jgi:hypothetical protein
VSPWAFPWSLSERIPGHLRTPQSPSRAADHLRTGPGRGSSPVSPITGECRNAPDSGAFRRSGGCRGPPVVPPWSLERSDARQDPQASLAGYRWVIGPGHTRTMHPARDASSRPFTVSPSDLGVQPRRESGVSRLLPPRAFDESRRRPFLVALRTIQSPSPSLRGLAI